MNMKRIFIDGGANVGNSIEFFLNSYPNADEYVIYSFECNPNLFKELDSFSDKANIYHKALGTRNEKLDFFVGGDLSSSLRGDKFTGKRKVNKLIHKVKSVLLGNKGWDRIIKVDVIDLADFVKNNFSKDDFIVLKLDIEGGEYDLIPHLIKAGLFDGYIDRLYGEWHYNKLDEVSLDDHKKILNDLKTKGFTMKEWCAEKLYYEE